MAEQERTHEHRSQTVRFIWPQILVPVFILILTGMGSVVWYLVKEINRLSPVAHDLELYNRQGATWEKQVEQRLQNFVQYVLEDSTEMAGVKSSIGQLKLQMQNGTGDRFRGEDWARERRTIEAKMLRLEDLCVERFEGLNGRITPIEKHFWDNHWGGE